jgi:hypothetical protein
MSCRRLRGLVCCCEDVVVRFPARAHRVAPEPDDAGLTLPVPCGGWQSGVSAWADAPYGEQRRGVSAWAGASRGDWRRGVSAWANAMWRAAGGVPPGPKRRVESGGAARGAACLPGRTRREESSGRSTWTDASWGAQWRGVSGWADVVCGDSLVAVLIAENDNERDARPSAGRAESSSAL